MLFLKLLSERATTINVAIVGRALIIHIVSNIKRSHEPTYKTVTKNEATRLSQVGRAITLCGATEKSPILLTQ